VRSTKMKTFPGYARGILVVHIVSFGAHSFMVAVAGSPVIGLFVAGITVVPATLFLKKHRYGTLLFRSMLVITFLQWPFVILAAHEVDRTVMFWCLWVYFGLLIIADAFIAFRKWDIVPMEEQLPDQAGKPTSATPPSLS
jgi:hypothetical protein